MAQWDAVAKYARNAGNRRPGFNAASTLASEAARVIMGWTPALCARSTKDRVDLGRQAEAALAEWQLAGSPFLPDRVRRAQHFIQAHRNKAERSLVASQLTTVSNP